LLGEIALANAEDLDEAYRVTAQAQKAWAATLPADRSAVFLRAMAVMDARQDEIIDWIIRESGSTRLKASMEWGAVRAGMLEAATMPPRAVGRIQPIDVAGKESRTYVFRWA